MASTEPLTLPEEVLLLALRDEEGTIAIGSLYTYAVGGAVLAELILRRRLDLDSQAKKRIVRVVDTRPTGNQLLDDILARIHAAKKPSTAATWVSRIAGTKKLRDRLAFDLCDRGILQADEKKVLLLFSRRIYPEVDSTAESEIVDRLRHAILGSSDTVDPRTVVLVALAEKASLLGNVVEKKELAARKQRIAQITRGEALAEATQEAIAAVQAAVFVAVILPSITTTTVTH